MFSLDLQRMKFKDRIYVNLCSVDISVAAKGYVLKQIRDGAV